jgi:uncharacterized protein
MLNWHMFLLSEDYWEIRITKDKGRGVFACKSIPTGTIIGDYVGKLVQLYEVDFKKEKKNLYLMYYDDETGIYPDLKKPGIHLLNHSCSPNCWIYKFKRHTLAFALNNIASGEELTISYLLPPEINCHPCDHRCFCNSKNCTESMHLTEKKYKTWQNFQEKQKSKMDKISIKKSVLKPLLNYPMSVPKSYITKIIRLGII